MLWYSLKIQVSELALLNKRYRLFPTSCWSQLQWMPSIGTQINQQSANQIYSITCLHRIASASSRSTNLNHVGDRRLISRNKKQLRWKTYTDSSVWHESVDVGKAGMTNIGISSWILTVGYQWVIASFPAANTCVCVCVCACVCVRAYMHAWWSKKVECCLKLNTGPIKPPVSQILVIFLLILSVPNICKR